MNAVTLLAGILAVVAIALVFHLQKTSAALRDAQTRTEERARQLNDSWKQSELDILRGQYEALKNSEALVIFEQWKQLSEKGIRKDATQRSRSVIMGKVSEHLSPFLPGFAFNPNDARFLGSPVDFIVFDGLDEGDVREVVFVEVKTAGATLNKRERKVRDAILSKRVGWKEFRLPGAGEDVPTGASEPPPTTLKANRKHWWSV